MLQFVSTRDTSSYHPLDKLQAHSGGRATYTYTPPSQWKRLHKSSACMGCVGITVTCNKSSVHPPPPLGGGVEEQTQKAVWYPKRLYSCNQQTCPASVCVDELTTSRRNTSSSHPGHPKPHQTLDTIINIPKETNHRNNASRRKLHNSTREKPISFIQNHVTSQYIHSTST